MEEKAAREEKMATALLKAAPVGAELEFTFGESEMMLSKNRLEDMEDKEVTTSDGSIHIGGKIEGNTANVGLQVST